MPATVLVSHPCFLVAAGLTSMLARASCWQVRTQTMPRGTRGDKRSWHDVDAIVADAGWRASDVGAGATEHAFVVTTPRSADQPEAGARLPLHCDGPALIEAVTRVIEGAGVMAARGDHPRQACRGGLAPGALRRVLAHMDAHLSDRIGVPNLAEQAGVSSCHFSRAFRQSMGESAHRYLVGRRIDVAMTRLRETDDPLGEIGLEVGFSDQSHFTRVFHAVAGETPHAFRRRHR